jgi:hypothetical protein
LSEEEKNEALQAFLVKTDKIELADLRGDRMSLGDIYLRKSPEKDMFFRTKLKNVKIKTDTVYEFNFERAKYTLTLPELNEYFNNKMIFGGRLYADTSLKMYGLPIVFSNHGAFVARPNEPSLQRFVGELLKDAPDNREQKVQRLLDFVSSEIEYNWTEAIGQYETLKRPTEVLMSRNGDCSNKTILLASLLEQISEEYLLFYSPRHITVGVKQGNFPNENGLFYTWEGQTWLIAESTFPGFQIGKTPINDDKIKQAEYVQATKFRDAIYDVKDSGRRIDFK